MEAISSSFGVPDSPTSVMAHRSIRSDKPDLYFRDLFTTPEFFLSRTSAKSKIFRMTKSL